MRITLKQLEAQIEQLNSITNSPQSPWTQGADGKLTANTGNYHLSRGYGGYCVHRMANEKGGVTTPITHHHVPKRNLFNGLTAYIAEITEKQIRVINADYPKDSNKESILFDFYQEYSNEYLTAEKLAEHSFPSLFDTESTQELAIDTARSMIRCGKKIAEFYANLKPAK